MDTIASFLATDAGLSRVTKRQIAPAVVNSGRCATSLTLRMIDQEHIA